MKTSKFAIYKLLFLPISLLAMLIITSPAAAQVAIKGETVYPMSGAPIKNGVVLTNNGKITAIGPASSITIPNGYKVV
ncbi:MAG: amidohydrolase, partial [Acidobacteria bacterium]|nr:amidohydrolase [Acidobacteriota bacterium]